MISAVVIAKNEENNIVDCLETLSWCNEIIVVDDFSEDRTVEIAKKMGATVFQHHLIDDFSRQRNFGLEKARGDWVLFVDADERFSKALALEVSSIKYQVSSRIDGYYIKRTDIMWGKRLEHGETGNIKLLRLARKGKGEWRGKVHETWDIKGPVSKLKNELLHYPHPTITDFLAEINFYTSLRARELYQHGVKANWLQIIFYAKAKFIVNYFFKLGFLDGIQGLLIALLMSFHSFLVRAKLWTLWHKK